jgi:hypothetical protein
MPTIITVIFILWVICAIIAVIDRMDKGTAYVFNYEWLPDDNDIMLEYIWICFMSPYILFIKYVWKK